VAELLEGPWQRLVDLNYLDLSRNNLTGACVCVCARACVRVRACVVCWFGVRLWHCRSVACVCVCVCLH
jgi:hypothetical protein